MVRYLETFFRHRVLFAVPVVLILLVSGAVVLTQPIAYTASTRLWVDKPALGTTDEQNNPFVSPAAEQAESLLELMNTRYFTVKAAHRGPLARSLGSEPTSPSGIHWVTSKIRGGDTTAHLPSSEEVDNMAFDILNHNTQVYAVGPQIIEIDFTYGNPQVAAATAQSVIDQFLDETLSSSKARAQVVSDFYSGQVRQAQTALTSADQAVAAYLAQHPEFRSVTAVPDARLLQLQQADQQARQTVSDFQSKVDGARLSQAALGAPGASGMRLLDPAVVPAQAGVSRKLLVEALGAGLGVAAVVLVLGLLTLTLADTTLRRPEDVEQALGLRLAGSIPHTTAGPTGAR
jgi:uncharacterized protein involved in exopolysaccharide biosynthesis